MNKKTIEERLEDYCEFAEATKRFSDAAFYQECIDEIKALRAQAVEGDDEAIATEDLALKQSDWLNRIVNITKGEPEPLTLHSTHDAVESVEAMANRLQAAENAAEKLGMAIRDAAVSAGLCRDDVELSGPQCLMLMEDLTAKAKDSGFRDQYFALIKTLDEVGQPWMRDDGKGGMASVIRRMAESARATSSPSDLDNVKHLCRFMAKQWVSLEAWRHDARKLAASEMKEALLMRWPIIQGMENQKRLRAIAEQEVKGAKVSIGVKVLLNEDVGDVGGDMSEKT